MIDATGNALLDDGRRDTMLAASPAPRITQDVIEKRVKGVDYLVLPGTTTTICWIILDNGFVALGQSACADPRNFNADIGARYAYDDALRKLWPLFGFMLAEDLHRRSDALRSIPDEAIATLKPGGLYRNELRPDPEAVAILEAKNLSKAQAEDHGARVRGFEPPTPVVDDLDPRTEAKRAEQKALMARSSGEEFR